MSKAIILGAVAATGVVAATVPTAIMYGGSGSTSKPYIPQLDLASDIREKNKYKEVGCLNDYFGTITFNRNTNSEPKSSEISEFSDDSKSCLLVEYYKTTYSDEKWTGGFRLIWSLKDDKQGLITVINAKTKNNGFLWGSSAAYALTRDNSKNSWITSHKYEVGERRKDKDGIGNLIPQTTLSSSDSLSKTNYWGFNPLWNKVCKENDCSGTESVETKGSYSWEFVKKAESNTVYSWATDIHKWLKKIFEWEEFKSKMEKIKGEWQVKTHW